MNYLYKISSNTISKNTDFDGEYGRVGRDIISFNEKNAKKYLNTDQLSLFNS